MKSKGLWFCIALVCCVILFQGKSLTQEFRGGFDDQPQVVALGAISGHVYESDGTTPVANADIKIYDTSWNVVKWAYGDASGYYLAEYLGTGDYYVQATHTNYFDEYYNNSATQGGASLVTVSMSDTTDGIDFTLNKKGSISGTVTEEGTGDPIANAMVNVYNLSWESIGGAQTNASGQYTISGLDDGSFYLESTGYIVGEGEFFVPEYYDNSLIKGGASSVSVAAPAVTGGIDFVMTRGYHVYVDVIPDWGGTYEISPEKLVYAPGDEVTITAYAASEYHFDHWSEDASGTDSTAQVTMNSDKHVNAHFSPNESAVFNLTVNIEPEEASWYQLDPNQTEYDSGAVVGIEVFPNTGWQFGHWSGDLEGDANPKEIVMNANKIVNAHFGHQLETFVHPEGIGEISRDPSKEIYEHNEEVELTAHAPEGYVFSYWDGSIEGTENPITVTMNCNKEVIAKFKSLVTLTMQASPAEGGTTDPSPGEHVYIQGDTVEISAIPAEGYQFKRWECVVGDYYDPNTYVVMNGNETVTAVFEPVNQEVTLEMKVYPSEGGWTNPEPGIYTYAPGDTVEISALPETGYHFKKWEGEVHDLYSQNTYVVLDDSKTVWAKFESNTTEVTLTMQISPAEGGTTDPAPGPHVYVQGDTVDISAIPAEGYRFKRWNCIVGDHYSPETYVVMIANETVTAVFEPIVSTATLTVNVEPEEGGVTVPDAGSHSYDKGTLVLLSAEPNEGYEFINWTGGVADPDSASTSILLNENKTITAHFSQMGYTLTMRVDPENGGTTEPAPGQHVYIQGDTVDITAIPAEGYQFKKWECVVGDHYDPNTYVVMNSNETVTAVFEPVNQEVTLTIQVKPDSGGTTDPEPGNHVYVEGDTVEVSALPACGYIFVKWIGDVEDSTDQNTQIVMTGSQEIRAVFESIKVTLTMHADPEKGGTIEPTTGKHNYLVGDTVHIAAVPNEGYEFVKWKGGIADSLSSETDFVIIESKTITALFSELDLIPPELKNCFPVPKAASVPKNTQIKFTAQDKQTGVNLGTLQAWVNEFQIIANGLDQTGGLIDIHEKEKGYKITYRPSEDFEEGIGVTVRALFSDLASPPNSCDSSYVFHVGKSQADTSKVQEVGQAGGTVQDSTSGIEIHIPENALEDSVEISISKVDEPPPLPLGVTGLALTHHFGPDGLHFNNAVVIQIPYTQSDLDSARVTHPEDLRLFYFHTATGIWEEIDVDSVDVIRQLLFIHVEEFCYFTFGVERGQTTDVSETQTNLPKTFGLMQNYPNPFNPETAIGFDVPEPSPVKITVYNISGRIIRTLVDEKKSPGHFTVLWDGRNQQGNMVSTGIYFYVMKAGDRVFVKKMSFVK